MRRHFKVIIGNWKFSDWHLYRWTKHWSKKKVDNIWHTWDKII